MCQKKTISNWLVDVIVNMRLIGMNKWIPKPIRNLKYLFVPARLLEQKTCQEKYKQVLKNSKRIPLQTAVTLGIIEDFMGTHAIYEAACLELGVPYKLIDISGDLWEKAINDCICDIFLVWPFPYNSAIKQMYDERLRVMVEHMNKIIFPSYEALWLYESKRRTNYWLNVNKVPHPRTFIFFNKTKALNFLKKASFPLVFKTDLGATASGVEIVYEEKNAKRLINVCFGRGYLRKGCVWNDRSQGCILFQEYISNVKEWRMVRIGDSFFGHQKLKKGEFHSGSKLIGWDKPPRELLDFCRDVTNKGSFLSMDLDVFETEEGEYLVNELQALFGSANAHQMYIDGKPGRFLYDEELDSWNFEKGDFCRNILCNLRVETVLNLVEKLLVSNKKEKSHE